MMAEAERGHAMSQEAAGTQMPAVSRIARDIADGIILLDSKGTIQYVNPSAGRLLGNDALQEGIPYARYMAADNNSANDDFHQYVLDSAYERNGNHRGVVTYTRPDGGVRYFSIETSFAGGEDGLQKTGVILQFSDITDLHLAKVKHDDTIKVLAGTILIMALWNFIAAIWESLGRPISSTALTVIIEAIGVAATLFALRYTSITVADFGLGTKNLKQAVTVDTALTLAVLVLMIAAKLILRQFFPTVMDPKAPFFRWNALEPLDLLYIPTVVLQELLVRGVMQGSLERILPDSYPPAVANIIASLVFGAVHIHKGIVYMVGAALLLSFFGILYSKQKTIWGLCIPHLVLSWSLRILW